MQEFNDKVTRLKLDLERILAHVYKHNYRTLDDDMSDYGDKISCDIDQLRDDLLTLLGREYIA